MIDKLGGELKDYGPLVVRLGLSTIFILQGAESIRHVSGSSDGMKIALAVVTLLGGLFLLIGFMTRWAGFALAAFMIYKISDGPRLNAFLRADDQIYLACLVLSIVAWMFGGGKLSLDEKAKKKD
jgi:uncharacterized membrane protein YphA (DoxX/SURF4 family)